MAGIVFTCHEKYDPYPGKYSFDNWNRAVELGEPGHLRVINHLVKGNFYCLMNHILDFEYSKELDIYIPKKERRFGAKRT